MKLELNVKQFEKLIKYYYEKYENINCKIITNPKIEYTGYYDDKTCTVEIIQIITKKLLDEEVELKKYLNLEDLKKILGIVLLEENMEVLEINFDCGIRYDNYDLHNNNEVEYFYFNGVNLKVNEIKNKVKEKR